jgi:hypothetical protein
MLQAFVLNVSTVFLDICCNCVYLDVVYVSGICCKCFIWMLCMFYMVFKCFSYVFASVLDACFKCFICLQMYVASVTSRCFKSRSGVASRSLLAFNCLTSFSQCWLASEPETQVCAPPPLLLNASDVARDGPP